LAGESNRINRCTYGTSEYFHSADDDARAARTATAYVHRPTQIDSDWFMWFGTPPSKSRLNFLVLLCAGHSDYVLNDAHMRRHDLSAPTIAPVTAGSETPCDHRAAWQEHLERLGYSADGDAGSNTGRFREGFVEQHSVTWVFMAPVVLGDDAGSSTLAGTRYAGVPVPETNRSFTRPPPLGSGSSTKDAVSRRRRDGAGQIETRRRPISGSGSV
jgi:hypothetical protein